MMARFGRGIRTLKDREGRCGPGKFGQGLLSGRIGRAVNGDASRHPRRTRPVRWLAGFVLLAAGLGSSIMVIRAHQAAGFDAGLAVGYVSTLVALGITVLGAVRTLRQQRAALLDAKLQIRRLLRNQRSQRRTEDELRSAKDKAEAANQAKTRYMTGLSHELRTPLNAIYGFAQILEKSPDIPAGRQNAITTIRRSSEHLAGLIEGLLDVSRIESGRIEIQRDRIDLSAFLNQIASIFEANARQKGIAFHMETFGKLPKQITGDEKRLRQIMINLLSNAVRYTDSGQVDFLFHYRSEVAVIEVRDTGIGIQPDELDSIWQPFRRGRGLRQPGSGLGLTITKLLVEVLGGEIGLQSEVGKGSVFRVRLLLPSVPHPGPDDRSGDANPAAERPVEYAAEERTILLVDDDPDHLALLASFLEPIGFVVHTASTAEQALARLSGLNPDLFVFDIDLPALDGWELARRVRADAPAKAPIIMISSHASDDRVSGSGRDLCDAFLAKPYTLDDLLTRIAGLLKLRRRSGPGRLTPPESEPDRSGTLPREAIEELIALASIGHARQLETRIDAMERAHPDAQALIASLRRLYAGLDMPGIVKFLEGTLRDGS